MPGSCQWRCPNVINIFWTWGVEKDSLLSLPSFVSRHSLIPCGSYYSRPAPIFLLMHPPLRGGRRFSICISLHLFPPSPSLPLPYTDYHLRLLLPFLHLLSLFPVKAHRLNSQRPHWEESVNATGKREKRERTSNLWGVYLATLLRRAFLLSRRNSNFVAIYMEKPESASSSGPSELCISMISSKSFAGLLHYAHLTKKMTCFLPIISV